MKFGDDFLYCIQVYYEQYFKSDKKCAYTVLHLELNFYS